MHLWFCFRKAFVKDAVCKALREVSRRAGVRVFTRDGEAAGRQVMIVRWGEEAPQ